VRDGYCQTYQELVETTDVRAACDLFGGVYQSTRGGDGYVSIEVSPGVAHDFRQTVDEALRLWKTVDRPNVMVKVPGTEEGALAVRDLISRGVNVNITLLFSLDAHARVIDAAREVLRYTEHRADIRLRPDMPTGPINRVADNSLAKQLLDWEPKMKFMDGLHRTVDWYFATKDRADIKERLPMALVER